MHPWTLYALEVARDREREANNRRLLTALQAADPSSRRWSLRRPAARVFATLSRTSAAVVRRLDGCVAEDLGRSLTATK